MFIYYHLCRYPWGPRHATDVVSVVIGQLCCKNGYLTSVIGEVKGLGRGKRGMGSIDNTIDSNSLQLRFRKINGTTIASAFINIS